MRGIDGRAVMVALIVLLGISSSHLFCSKQFSVQVPRSVGETRISFPAPSTYRCQIPRSHEVTRLEDCALELERMQIGARTFYLNYLGCLYTPEQLMHIQENPDRYEEELRYWSDR